MIITGDCYYCVIVLVGLYINKYQWGWARWKEGGEKWKM